MKTLTYDDITEGTKTACSKCLQPCGTTGWWDEDQFHQPFATVVSNCCGADLITEEEAERIVEDLTPDVVAMERAFQDMEVA
jgi:hypothetical protein